MKPSYISTLILAVVCAVPLSCNREEFWEEKAQSPVFTIVGNPVEVHLGISVGDLSFDVSTRAEIYGDPDGEDSEEEKRVDDLWVFEYSESTGRLIYPPERVTISEQKELADIKATLSDNNGDPVTIYVVANSGSGVKENSEGWVTFDSATQSYEGFMTVEDLENNVIPTPHPQRLTWSEQEEKYILDSQDASAVSIPMGGSVTGVTIGEDSDVLIHVTRMFAKLMVRVDLSGFNSEDETASLSTVTVGNIPEYCTVETLWDGVTTGNASAADYSACNQWIQRRFTETLGESSNAESETDDDLYPYIIYVPENIQGENGTDANKANNAPAYGSSETTRALSVAAGITIARNGSILPENNSYVAYPGGNNTTNFNVRRNCVYRVTLKITDIVDEMVPSANCIVCLSGETTAFWPYYRVETGGGYKFSDYLDANDDTGEKVIDHVGIIWQSTNANSNSGTGFMGDNTDNSLVWIDDLENGDAADEYHRMIHVTIPEGKTGNALVAAYNSDGVIIWSWHIWARTRETDPTTVNTKLYYTYQWDSNGIYGKDSDRERVAGYTIMNSNLGAMQDDPSGDVGTMSNVVPTFGLQYEWGRKDPFPSYNRSGGNSNGVFVAYSSYVQKYYDNGDVQVAFADYAQTEAKELFHSLPGKDRPTTFDEAIRQSIQNPTAYLCGTNEAQAYDGPQLGVSSSSHSLKDDTERRDSLAVNFPYPHDGNWLYDDESEHYNSLWGGLDPEHDAISKSYNTGYTSALGDIHLYDDYGEKSIFDPCPYGWRVSPPDLWLGFTDNGKNPSDLTHVNYAETNSGTNGMYMYLTGWLEGETSFFPTQGTRQANGAAYKIGNCGNYHNATADSGGRVNIMHVHFSGSFNIFENTSTAYYLKSVASPVRCVRIDSVQQ